jgi:hypothetical protein
MATKNLKKDLTRKKKDLEAAFEKHKKSVQGIDNLMQKLSGDRKVHTDEMTRLQGEFRLVQELLGEEPEQGPAKSTKKRS